MKLIVTEKKVASVDITSLSSGDVFCLANEMHLNKKERNYFIVTARNGHREYYNLKNGANKPFNTDCSVIKVDCSLTIYDTIE